MMVRFTFNLTKNESSSIEVGPNIQDHLDSLYHKCSSAVYLAFDKFLYVTFDTSPCVSNWRNNQPWERWRYYLVKPLPLSLSTI